MPCASRNAPYVDRKGTGGEALEPSHSARLAVQRRGELGARQPSHARQCQLHGEKSCRARRIRGLPKPCHVLDKQPDAPVHVSSWIQVFAWGGDVAITTPKCINQEFCLHNYGAMQPTQGCERMSTARAGKVNEGRGGTNRDKDTSAGAAAKCIWNT